MKKIVFVFLTVLISKAHAGVGNETGNGGDSVVCRDSKGALISAEFFDIYEGRSLRGQKVDLGPASLAVGQKVALAFGLVSPSLYPSGRVKTLSRFNFGPPIVTIGDFEGNDELEIGATPSVSFFDLDGGIIRCATLEGPTILKLVRGGQARFDDVQVCSARSSPGRPRPGWLMKQ